MINEKRQEGAEAAGLRQPHESVSQASASGLTSVRAPPMGGRITDSILREEHATLVLGPPMRLPYINVTMRQLREK